VVDNGGVNNVANPRASGALNQALGPAVFNSLADALKDLGDWAGAADAGGAEGNAGGDEETILGPGGVDVMDADGVKNIPPDQAPAQLRNALGGDVLKGMGAGAGH